MQELASMLKEKDKNLSLNYELVVHNKENKKVNTRNNSEISNNENINIAQKNFINNNIIKVSNNTLDQVIREINEKVQNLKSDNID